MKVRKLRIQDVHEVSLIHQSYLKQGILSHLGEQFLEVFYKTLLVEDTTFTLVVTKNRGIVGFATGAVKLNAITRIMLSKLWVYVIFCLFKNPAVFMKLIQMPLYPSFRKDTLGVGEIFSIAVMPQHRGMGIGTNLINACAKEFKKRDCPNFQLSVRKKMRYANKFYIKIGLKKKGKAKFLGEDIVFYGN